MRLPTNHLLEISHKNVTVDKFKWYSIILKEKKKKRIKVATTHNKVKYVDMVLLGYDIKHLPGPASESITPTYIRT